MSKALHYWQISLRANRRKSLQGPPSDCTDMAQILHLIFIGAINSWIFGDLDADGMRRTVKDGIGLVLKGAALPSE